MSVVSDYMTVNMAYPTCTDNNTEVYVLRENTSKGVCFGIVFINKLIITFGYIN